MSLPLSQDFQQEISLYESRIADNPSDRSLYWELGLLYLINKMEDEAQFIWMSVLSNAEDIKLKSWRAELFQCITDQSNHCRESNEVETANLLVCHAYEILPDNVENSLLMLELVASQNVIYEIDLIIAQVIQNLNSLQNTRAYTETITSTINKLLLHIPLHPNLILLIESAIPYFSDSLSFLTVIFPQAIKIGYSLRSPQIAAKLLELYLLMDPVNLEVLAHLSSFYQNYGNYDRGIQIAKQRFELSDNFAEKIFSSHLILRGVMSTGGYWQEVIELSQQHIDMLVQIGNQFSENNLSPVQTLRLFTSSYYLPYLKDDFQGRKIINQISRFCQSSVRNYSQDFGFHCPAPSQTKAALQSPSAKLRIGYLSHCTFQHSVGWLARWLIQYHDRSKFELYGYFINDRPYDGLQQWYINQFDHVSSLEEEFGQDTQAFARKINEDDINILIDLDSITLDLTCEILAMKPAPIQATWLGWDAIGMNAIDYFIADPYVLPDNAQEFYTEKIWRLPETYLAVDGFEVAVPTLTRESLNISSESVIFLTAQRGYKRHRDTAILQMQIVAGTPNSYLVIKGFADDQAIQNFFYEIADEVGVDRDRLRFLASDPSEAVHRANLRIADVVLDTYPYNGATTTMETLWMEVPIVTRVGQQFAARNSYTMMMNAGITEGIAWSAEEYIEWGIKLGTDAKLRQEVSWKLRQSKKTSPLWNGKQFARQMEDAYQQMWNNYVLSAGDSNDV
jgi:predicted O-linked N-acetylglucosamine transferase (SPINDLY family)